MKLKHIRAVVACAVPITLLAWLIGSGAIAGVWHDLKQVRLGVVVASVSCMTLSLLLRAKRLQVEFRSAKHLPWVDAQRIILIHNLAINLLPFRSGELSLPYFLREYGISLGRSLVSLLKLRLQDALVLGLMALVLFPRFGIGLRMALAAASLAAVVLISHMARTQADLPEHKLSGVVALFRLHELTAETWWLCLSNWLVKMLGVAAVFVNLLDASIVQGLTAAVGGEVSALLPLPSIGSFGQYEVGSAFFLASGSMYSWGALLRCALIAHSLAFVTAVAYGVLALAFNGFRLLKKHG